MASFCPTCGTRLEPREAFGKARPVCPACGHVHFDDPKVAVGVVAARDGAILLTRRNHEPKMGCWSFPSGFVDAYENVREAAARETLEETGITVRVGRLLGVYQEAGSRVIYLSFAAEAEPGEPVVGDECLDVRFFPAGALPELAFEHDPAILAAWRATIPGGGSITKRGKDQPMVAARSPNYYTPREYLDLERQAEWKSEYIGGFIVAMSGASRSHNIITMNIGASLHGPLGNQSCEVYASDMRVHIPSTGDYTYPDVVVACGEPQFEDDVLDTLLTPVLIVEVLSPSTERYDRGAKFESYRDIPSLQEYVLVAQDRPSIEHYLRRGEQWLLTAVNDLDASVALPTIGCTLQLREVYRRVQVAAELSSGTPTEAPPPAYPSRSLGDAPPLSQP